MSAAWVLVLALATRGALCELEVVNEFTVLRFDTPYDYPVRNHDPVQSLTVFTGIEIGWDRLFLAMPRLRTGNPATLGFIPRNKPGVAGDIAPLIQAYPSWAWHRAAASGMADADNCTSLLSVFRIRADRCNRLWVLDSGVMDSLVNFRVVCPPKILIFDMRTDQLVRSITLPAEVLRRNSLLTNIVLDDLNDDISGGYGGCDNVFAYMSDTTNPALVVYDARRDSAWRLANPYMFPDPDFGTYRVLGESFTLMDGIIGLALTPPGTAMRTLYFQPFASDRLFSVPVSALRSGPNQGDDADLPVTTVGHKSSQAAGLAIDPRDGAILFSPISETAIAAWTPGTDENRVLAFSPEKLQFPLDLRAADRDGGTVWIITTRFQKFFRRTVNPREVNLRIMRIVSPEDYSRYQPNSTLLLYRRK